MNTRPLVALSITWVAGSALAASLRDGGFGLVLSGIILIGLIVIVFSSFLKIMPTPRSMLLLLFVFLIASLYWNWNDRHNQTVLPQALNRSAEQLIEQPVQAEGMIVGAVEVDGDFVRFPMMLYKLDHTVDLSRKEKVLVQLKLAAETEVKQAETWKRGDMVTINGIWKEPGGARNFDAFDYRSYLRTQHMHWILSVKGASSLQPSSLEPAGLSMWSRYILRQNDAMRIRLGERIESIFTPSASGYVKGLLIGDSEDVSPEVYASFSRLGLTHILAISGMHVAIFTGLLLWGLRKIGLTLEQSCLVAMWILPCYVLLTGASPSAVRAGFMGMIGLYLIGRGRLKNSLHLLCVVCWMMLLYNPYYLLNVSFQMSFIVTTGLIVYVPLFNSLLQRLPDKLRSAIAVTIVAQFISFPLTSYYFNQFSLLSFIANFLLVPVSSVFILPVSTIVLAFSYIWLPASQWVGSLVSWVTGITFEIADWMDQIPGMLMIWSSPEIWWILVYYVLLYLILLCGRDINSWIAEQQPFSLRTNESNSRTSHNCNQDQHVSVKTSLPLTRYSSSPSWIKMPFPGLHWNIPWLRRRFIGLLAGGGALFLLLGYGYYAPYHHGEALVQYLDVGQGDSILITTPNNKHILVDGGGTMSFQPAGQEWRQRKEPYEIGLKMLVPLLKKRGIHELDAVILTHGDHDHAGGLQAVLEQIPVRQLIFNGTLPEDNKLDRLFQTALDRNIALYAPRPGMQWHPDHHTVLTFLGPELLSREESEDNRYTYSSGTELFKRSDAQSQVRPAQLPRKDNQNRYSVVFLLTLYDHRFLFTGDADVTEEQSILNELANHFNQLESVALPAQQISSQNKNTMDKKADHTSSSIPQDLEYHPIAIDVLKVGHHGSKTSTSESWLQYWQPRLSVISAGKNNLYGHPKDEVLERITASGSAIARTDLQGEIQIKVTQKGQLSMRTRLTADE